MNIEYSYQYEYIISEFQFISYRNSLSIMNYENHNLSLLRYFIDNYSLSSHPENISNSILLKKMMEFFPNICEYQNSVLEHKYLMISIPFIPILISNIFKYLILPYQSISNLNPVKIINEDFSANLSANRGRGPTPLP